MGKTYKATITVSCLKEHTCVGCGSKFAYPFSREVTGEAGNEEQAMLAAHLAANKAAEGEVDLHACPKCGLYQPEMIAVKRTSRYWWGLGLAVVGVALALILGATHVITIATSAYIATGVMGLVLALALLGSLYNPNKDLDGNRMGTEAKLTEQSAEHWNEPVGNVGGLTMGHFVGLILLLIAVLAALAPIVLASINGWVQNANTYPAVCGPGDKPCIYFDGKKITSVQGYWNGSVSAKITNHQELALANPTVGGETKDSNWGNTISGKSVSNSTNTMWAKVQLPANSSLVGKNVKMDITVNATYPYMVGDGFDNESRPFQHQTAFTLSAPKSGETYSRSWWMGQSGVLVLATIATFVFLGSCGSLKKQGNPTSIAPMEPEATEEV